MSNVIESLSEKDVNSLLHPYTDARLHQETGPLIIERGEGIYVFDDQGKKYIEGMSGLWSVAVGFNNQRLIAAAHEQMSRLPYYHIFNQKSHRPSIELADRLLSIAPAPMSKVFFTNSGSEANDTLIKLVWYRNNSLGLTRKKKFISRKSGYHGITIASGSLTGLPNNHRSFDLPLPGFLHVSAPHHYRDAKSGETEEDYATRLAAELDALIQREGAETVAAFIAEPVIGAGGVLVPPRTYWAKIQEVCRRNEILLLIDEVICGFGRTGNMFGCETYGIKPDAMVVSKQLSSSYQPIAAVLVNENIFEPIADETHRIGTLGHGLTASGHPVATAVALENLNVIEEEGLVENACHVGELLLSELGKFNEFPLVGEVRGVGLLAAIELKFSEELQSKNIEAGSLGRYMAGRAQHHGLIIRPIGDAVALCPPLITRPHEIDSILGRLKLAMNDTQKWCLGSS
ncbi:aspartate aminotransferase family protein [Pseudomonas sp. BGr12]|uniref:aspartate aminotransferase family protein n=1 Tax=Pseudomonas sp. BGr12 TaxID=2936269 RepID=UPI002559F1DD|nr:aspartate aminotransferase family protein [Pseudomonas sp. BJa5]MDL2428398.1 aspartate aminotransferase family protein [Pseudomonas sp. BJa5]